jgi:hypothetical protein
VYRAQIVMQDEQKGGKSYLINDQCSIDRYYRVAEKVSSPCKIFIQQVVSRYSN